MGIITVVCIVAFIFGGICGIFIMALACASKRKDDKY